MFEGEHTIDLDAASVQRFSADDDSLLGGFENWGLVAGEASDFQQSFRQPLFEVAAFSVGPDSPSDSERSTAQATGTHSYPQAASEYYSFSTTGSDGCHMGGTGSATNIHEPSTRQRLLSTSFSMPDSMADRSTTDTPSSASFVSFSEDLLHYSKPLVQGPVWIEQMGDLLLDNDILDFSNVLTSHRAIGPPRKPKGPRHPCSMCRSSFSRPSDLKRHEEDVHERSAIIYKCNECKHGKFGRLDKIKEHCRSRKHGGYSVLERAANSELASALHASRRRMTIGCFKQW